MSHLTVRSAYRDLADRINRFPQGAPPSDVLFAILKLLFSEREAGLVALLPIRPFTVEDAARRWKMPEAEARQGARRAGRPRHPAGHRAPRRPAHLRPAAADGRLLRVLDDAGAERHRPEAAGRAVLPVPERRRGVHPRPVRPRRNAGSGRVFVNEAAVPAELSLHVLDYERASEVVEDVDARSASASATAGTRCSTSGRRATRRSTSA